MEITVGCRVAEVDFSYGDGLVESIAVPVSGGGFNVGVKWDEPGKGGSTWSLDEGGGRAGQHLLVIQQAETPAAHETATEPPPPSLRDAFIARFDRSPTASEAELGEDDWDNLESEDTGAAREAAQRRGPAPQPMPAPSGRRPLRS